MGVRRGGVVQELSSSFRMRMISRQSKSSRCMETVWPPEGGAGRRHIRALMWIHDECVEERVNVHTQRKYTGSISAIAKLSRGHVTPRWRRPSCGAANLAQLPRRMPLASLQEMHYVLISRQNTYLEAQVYEPFPTATSRIDRRIDATTLRQRTKGNCPDLNVVCTGVKPRVLSIPSHSILFSLLFDPDFKYSTRE